MDVIVRREATVVRVPNTPEALFKAAGVLALAGLILAILSDR